MSYMLSCLGHKKSFIRKVGRDGFGKQLEEGKGAFGVMPGRGEIEALIGLK